MNHAIELGYVGVEVSRPRGDCATFFTDIVGLAPSEPTPTGDATWTDDDAAQRVIVVGGPGRTTSPSSGSRPSTTPRSTRSSSGSAAAGLDVRRPADGAAAEARRVERLAVVDAPWGTPVEVAIGLDATRPAPARRSCRAGSSPRARASATRSSPPPRSTSRCGSRPRAWAWSESDWLETEIAAGIELEVRFFHCNARHHSLALARAPFELPQRLHHLMFETNDRDDVGQAFDRAFAAGLAAAQRARPPRQRPDVLLLRGQPGRLPGRGRPRRPPDHRAVDRRPPLRPASAHGAISPSCTPLRRETRPMTTEVILTGTGVPHPAPGHGRAPGPSCAVATSPLQFDAGRATVLRLMEAGTSPPALQRAVRDPRPQRPRGRPGRPRDDPLGPAAARRVRAPDRRRSRGRPRPLRAPHARALRRGPRATVDHVGADPIEVDLRPFALAGAGPRSSGRATTAPSVVSAVAVHHEPVPDAVAYRVETPDGAS